MNVEETVAMNFKEIRDMPFEAGSSSGDYHKDLEYIKNNKRGSCTPKHYLLGLLCEKLGLSVNYLTYPFYWKDQPLPYPKNIQEIVYKLPLAYHLALSININGKIFFLDATWDPPLGKAGFYINETDGGLGNMQNAVVKTKGCVIHKSALARDSFVKKILKKRECATLNEAVFYNNELNQWLKEIRRS